MPQATDSFWTVPTAEMCRILGVDAPELSRLHSQGAAVKLGRDRWDAAETVRLYLVRLRERTAVRAAPAEVAAEKARLMRAQADKAEAEVARLRAELVPTVEVERAWSGILRAFRSRVLAVPARLRQSLALDAATAEGIDRELRAALTELGGGGGDH